MSSPDELNSYITVSIKVFDDDLGLEELEISDHPFMMQPGESISIGYRSGKQIVLELKEI